MPKRVLYGILSIAVIVGVAACDEKLSSLTGPTPSLEPKFSSIQHEIFESTDSSGRTPCVQCHTNVGRNPAGGLNLLSGTSYASLVGVGSLQKPGATRVVAGDPATSYLIQKIEGAAGISGRRMPFNGPPYLTDGQILVIKRWIELGAKND
jgi:hypothetical protein